MSKRDKSFRLLLTGFEPFGGSRINPSCEVVRAIETRRDELADVDLHTRILPVEAKRGPRMLLAAVDEVSPHAMLCLGESGKARAITLERVFVNLADYRIADNAGVMLSNRAIVARGPAAYFSTLPLTAMHDAVNARGIPVEFSLSAGTFLCNHVAYALLHHVRRRGVRAGFVHLPRLPDQVRGWNGAPDMRLDAMLRGGGDDQRYREGGSAGEAQSEIALMLTRRTLTPEHMDDPNASREDLALALRFLRMANARLGGTGAALRQFKRWAADWPPASSRESPIRILDIGTGSADIPLAIATWARKTGEGRRVAITAVDRHPVTCDLAREFLREHGGDAADDITIVQVDALKLTDLFASGSFDYAHAGLFLHHLSDIEVMTVLRIMDRLATRGMIWNDLVRVRFPRLMMWPALIGAPAMVKHDAIVSARAGFTKAEAFDLVRRAGWNAPRWRRHLVHRFTLVAEKASS